MLLLPTLIRSRLELSPLRGEG
ncbi:hypothetical protein LINPERHAP2_LOCUS34085 [Linum perenne]